VESRRWKVRHYIYAHILEWFKDRGHRVVISAIVNHAFQTKVAERDTIALGTGSPYVAGVLHLALMIQHRNQAIKKNKGKTLLIMDQQTQHEKVVSELLATSPSWTDSYYRWKQGDRLDQILDTAYFVRSHHASFVQIADLIAYAVNRHLELQMGGKGYPGEKEQREKWFLDLIRPTLIEETHRLPKGKDAIAVFYRSVTPSILGGTA